MQVSLLDFPNHKSFGHETLINSDSIVRYAERGRVLLQLEQSLGHLEKATVQRECRHRLGNLKLRPQTRRACGM